jgi:hypothetical protein
MGDLVTDSGGEGTRECRSDGGKQKSAEAVVAKKLL